ncbi:sugar phosphate isomerase/epimerase [Candidatus Woesearchaeota archaeon]|nr:sugar phosphate isomerase/epimerase [Candidatus Woesearchaeota archaeon]
MNRIGVMQGRLSPPVNNRIQAFPKDSWKNEFYSANKVGLDCIEWIFEEDISQNPVFNRDGINEIKQVIEKTGVNIYSVCADYFMKNKLFGEPAEKLQKNMNVLKNLINSCSELNVKFIIIPCVDESELKSKEQIDELANNIKQIIPLISEKNINLSLETSLNPIEFMYLMNSINHPLVSINFDTGNSASLGYSAKKEIPLLGKWIKHIHIKDRHYNGGTVPLGEGDTKFDVIFDELNKIGYNGIFILQGARKKSESDTIFEYKNFLINYLNKFFNKEAE